MFMCVVNLKSVKKLDLNWKQSLLMLVDSEHFGRRSLYQFDRLFWRDYKTKMHVTTKFNTVNNIRSKQEGWRITMTRLNSISTRTKQDKWYKMCQLEPKLLSLSEWNNRKYRISGAKKQRIRWQQSSSSGRLMIWQDQTTGMTLQHTPTWLTPSRGSPTTGSLQWLTCWIGRSTTYLDQPEAKIPETICNTDR